MAKVGRKPKLNAERYATGRLKPEPANKAIHLVTADLAAIAHYRRDPTWRTQIGRLTASGDLTAPCFAASKKLLEMRTDVDRILMLPNRNARAQDLNAVHGRGTDDEEGLSEKELEAKIISENKKVDAFYKAEGILDRLGCLAAVQFVVYYDCAPAGYQQLLDVRTGLKALALIWKMA